MKLVVENAITDLRKILKDLDLSGLDDKFTGEYDWNRDKWSGRKQIGSFKQSDTTRKDALVKWVEQTLKNDMDFNANDLNLVKTQKPKGPVVAKKSNDLLLGISTDSGDAVLIGEGKFYRYYSGRMGKGSEIQYDGKPPYNPEPEYDMTHKNVSLRDEFDYLDVWFKIIPVNADTYQTRSGVRKTLGRNAENRPGRYGWDPFAQADKKLPKVVRGFEIDLYDPEVNRQKYRKALNNKRDASAYDQMCDAVEEINRRISKINYTPDRRTLNELGERYEDMIYYLERAQEELGDTYWFKSKREKFSEKYKYISDYLTDQFNV